MKTPDPEVVFFVGTKSGKLEYVFHMYYSVTV